MKFLYFYIVATALTLACWAQKIKPDQPETLTCEGPYLPDKLFVMKKLKANYNPRNRTKKVREYKDLCDITRPGFYNVQDSKTGSIVKNILLFRNNNTIEMRIKGDYTKTMYDAFRNQIVVFKPEDIRNFFRAFQQLPKVLIYARKENIIELRPNTFDLGNVTMYHVYTGQRTSLQMRDYTYMKLQQTSRGVKMTLNAGKPKLHKYLIMTHFILGYSAPPQYVPFEGGEVVLSKVLKYC